MISNELQSGTAQAQQKSQYSEDIGICPYFYQLEAWYHHHEDYQSGHHIQSKKVNHLKHKRMLTVPILGVTPILRIEILESISPIACQAYAPNPHCQQ